MEHAPLIAKSIGNALNGVGHACEISGAQITIKNWGVRVLVDEGKAKQDASRAMIFPTILSYHRLFPRGRARELGVGMGETLEDAVQMISATWVMLFFPLMKFIFDEKPHDCFVHEESIEVPDATRGYRLFAGPVQFMGFGDNARPESMSQALMWSKFADLLLPTIRHGVHFVRCYAGKFANGVNADVFIDGEKSEEASARLIELANTFPQPDDATPLYSLKQHLMLRPDNLEASYREQAADQINQWMALVKDHVPTEQAKLLPNVLLALFIMSRPGTVDEFAGYLMDAGMSEQSADEYITFMQSAAARVQLAEKVVFPETYYWCNSKTRRAVKRRYDQTPVLMASIQTLGTLWKLGEAQHEIWMVATGSAEMNTLEKAMDQGVKLESMKFTMMIHSTSEPVEGENLDDMVARDNPTPPTKDAPKKPWWKIW